MQPRAAWALQHLSRLRQDNLTISGSLTRSAKTSYTLEVFGNPTAENKTYLGSSTITTDCDLENCASLRDLSGLKGLPLAQLSTAGCPVKDLSPLRGMPLASQQMDRCLELHDLNTLANMKLVEFRLPPHIKKGVEVLRKIPSLKTIDGRPACQFWLEYAAPASK